MALNFPAKAAASDYGVDQLIADNAKKRKAAAAAAAAPKLGIDLTDTQAGVAWQNMEVYGTPAPARVTTTSAPAAAYTPPVDKLDLADVGWNRAFLATYPEIAALFRRGVAKGWGAEKVQAQFRNTKFYKNNVESWRTTEILRLTDPKTYNQKIGNVRDELIAAAEAMGATLTGKALTSAVNQVYRLGLGGEQGVRSTQVTKLLSNYIVTSNGVLGGAAGTTQQELKALARANGVSYNDNWYTTAAKNVVGGVRAAQDYENDIRAQAASAFPVYAEQIKAGQNVADIASPYVQRMSALLEINSSDVDLFDNQIRQALSGIDSSTGKAQAKSLWQFENDLRKDDRWQYTNNARERTSNVASGILRRWGLSG